MKYLSIISFLFTLLFTACNSNSEKDYTTELEKGEAFLKSNKQREGVVETESGLQYKILVNGQGAKPSGSSANVTVHYHGTTIDGVVFDSSVERNEQITFGLGQVIAGWTEGLQLMNVGSKYRFFIPSKLAYGKRGAGSSVKPGAVLIFDVELFKVD